MRRLLRAVMLVTATGAVALGAAAPAWGQETPAAPAATSTLPAGTAPPTTTPAGVAATPAPATTSPAAPAAATTTPAANATTTTAAAAAPAGSDGDGPAAWLVGLIVLGALALLVLVLWGLARLTAWEPRWLPAARHSIGEAGYRTSAGWAEFRDWLRFGR